MRLAVPPIDPTCFATWRQDAAIVEMAGETMGTTWRIKLTPPPGFDSTHARRAIEARLESLLAQMSHWREDSLLSRFNHAAPGTGFTLPDDFAKVLHAGLDVAQRSAGAFDPAIGAIVNLWGHGPRTVGSPPTPAQLAQARHVSGYQRLIFEEKAGRLHQPGGVHLDLSGIAKGFAVDALARLLRGHGCEHALVEIGGELVGMGLKPDGQPWWVDLETPTHGIAPLRIALHQRAVATSGDYVRGHHTIDPRDGRPVKHAMAVSVVHDNAMLADAWATALSVHLLVAVRTLATHEALCVRVLMRGDAGLEEWVSPALQALMED